MPEGDQQLEKFEQMYQDLKKRYDKFELHYYGLSRIGIMSLTWLMFKREEDKNSGVLHVFIPFFHPGLPQGVVANNFLLHKFVQNAYFVSNENAPFWNWCLQNHSSDCVFINNPYIGDKYSPGELVKRCMNFGWADTKTPLITFDDNEVQFAKNELKRFGLENKQYMCFSNRDIAYYEEINKLPGQNRDPAVIARNADVDNYKLMAKLLLQRGVYSVRMGHAVEKGIEGDGIVDYASHFRSDIMDLYLVATCRFFVAGASGIQLMGSLLHTPLVLVNFPIISFGGDLVTPLNPGRDLMILKKLWHTKEQRYLSIREMLRMERTYKDYYLFHQYANRGIEFHENTPEELADVALEMDMRLRGELSYSIEDEMLQMQYRKILYEELGIEKLNWYDARIGTQFLRKNPFLLV